MTTVALRRWFERQVGGSWGDNPGESEHDALCIRGTDLVFDRLDINIELAPIRGFTTEDIRRRSLRPGDLVIEKSGGGDVHPVGRVGLYRASSPAVPTNFAARLRPTRDVDSRFAAYQLASLYFAGRTMAAVKQTTGIQNLDLDELLANRVRLPPLTEQRAIADYLDAETARIDALITKKQQLIHLLEERRSRLTLAGVVGEMTHDGSFRRSGLPWADAVPEHWDVALLRLVARQGTGHTPSRVHPEWWLPEECVVPWVTTGEVQQVRSDRARVISETREKISLVGIANSSAEIHPDGTVFLCRTASAGYSGIMGSDMATSQDFATWTCGEHLDPEYLLFCLRAMRPDLLGRLATGSTHKTIYMPDIQAIKIPVPPVEEQRAIAALLKREIDKSFAIDDAMAQQVGLLAEHRQALVTAAVTGEFTVPGAA